MAASVMGRYIAQAAAEARTAAGRKRYHIAAAAVGEGANPSTVFRFEKGEAWPKNPDHMVDLYAADLELSPIALWARALELWRAEVPDAGAGPPAPPGELGRRIEDPRPSDADGPPAENPGEGDRREGSE
ncbi:MAG TPA: hypothetical protein VG275_07145 [Solirubrobacteraceae bacterium]|jgi:hypothetical protein|nr:hypothetical protein [Solirubrobacteraceae bacterium]